MGTKSFRELTVWHKAMELVVETYRLADLLPVHERYGLAGQLRRSAASIPANIAEGNFRLHRGDYIRHVSFARGSLGELVTHLDLVCRVKYLHPEELAIANELADHVGRMLTRMASSLNDHR